MMNVACTVSQAIIHNIRIIDEEVVLRDAAEAITDEILSSLKPSAPSDEHVVRFDPRRCPWKGEAVLCSTTTAGEKTGFCKLYVLGSNASCLCS